MPPAGELFALFSEVKNLEKGKKSGKILKRKEAEDADLNCRRRKRFE